MSDTAPCIRCGKLTSHQAGPEPCCETCFQEATAHPRLHSPAWMNQFIESETLRAGVGDTCYQEILGEMELFALDRELALLQELTVTFEHAREKRKHVPGMFKGADDAIGFALYALAIRMRDLTEEHIALLEKHLMEMSDPRSTEKVQ